MSYQVNCLLGGGRTGKGLPEQTETFTSQARALAFKADVEDAGHQWPTDSRGIKWIKGEGFVYPTEQPPPVLTVGDVAESYLQHQTRMMKLGHLKPYTLHRYRRSYVLHLSTTFGDMAFGEVTAIDIEDWMVEQRDLGLPEPGREAVSTRSWVSSSPSIGLTDATKFAVGRRRRV